MRYKKAPIGKPKAVYPNISFKFCDLINMHEMTNKIEVPINPSTEYTHEKSGA